MDIPDPARVGSACCLVLRVAGTVLGMAASAAAAQDNIAGSAGTQTVCATISADEIRLSPGNFSVLPIGQKVGVTDARVSISGDDHFYLCLGPHAVADASGRASQQIPPESAFHGLRVPSVLYHQAMEAVEAWGRL